MRCDVVTEDFLSRLSPLEPPCFAPTGPPQVGCDSASRTDDLGQREAMRPA